MTVTNEIVPREFPFSCCCCWIGIVPTWWLLVLICVGITWLLWRGSKVVVVTVLQIDCECGLRGQLGDWTKIPLSGATLSFLSSIGLGDSFKRRVIWWLLFFVWRLLLLFEGALPNENAAIILCNLAAAALEVFWRSLLIFWSLPMSASGGKRYVFTGST